MLAGDCVLLAQQHGERSICLLRRAIAWLFGLNRVAKL